MRGSVETLLKRVAATLKRAVGAAERTSLSKNMNWSCRRCVLARWESGIRCAEGDPGDGGGIPHRLRVGVPAPRTRRCRSGTLLACLVLGACSGASPVAEPTTTSDPPVASTSTAPPTTSTTRPITTTAPAPEEDVREAWDAFWEAWSAVRASETLDPTPLEPVADPDVIERAVALFERQRESGLGPVETEVATFARVTMSGSDAASIEDCVLLSPPFTATASVWYRADLSLRGERWVVSDLRIPSAGGCVPAEMAEGAIASYEAFYDGWAQFWDPPDPDHPLLDELLADPQRRLIVGLIAEHEARGVALRGRPWTHAEVIEVRGPRELVILSCFEVGPAYGLYDLETGARLDDVPVVREGQRNLESAVMVLEGDRWKVSDMKGQVDFPCAFAPTDRGLPSV